MAKPCQDTSEDVSYRRDPPIALSRREGQMAAYRRTIRTPRRACGEHGLGSAAMSPREAIMATTTLLALQPNAMSPAQLAAVSYLARYSLSTHRLYTYQLGRWFDWCEINNLDPLVGIQRAHVELYIRHLGQCGLLPSSVNTMMNGVRGYFRYAHIDGLIAADPAVYARLPKVHHDESRTQGLDPA
jgi:Phage integrase, N-terminal SAM-like domain